MKDQVRKFGIDVLSEAPWGTHLCHFYDTKEDLIDTLVPYFKAGLENNEFCMWVTAEPLGVDDAKASLGEAVENLDDYIERGQIEILDYSQWYTISGQFNADEVLQGWIEKLNQALQRGLDGLRLSRNTFWLEKRDWDDFAEYEASIDNLIGKYRILAICSYFLGKCGPYELIDVVKNHEFALVRRHGTWELFESTGRKQEEERIIHLNAVLWAIRNINQLIIKEKDSHRLIKAVCDNFIASRGYYSAWIALFDESRNFIALAEAGLGEKFSWLLETLERGDLAKCGREALGQSGVLAIVNPIDVCDDCPLSKIYAGSEAMTIRLEYDDKVYGIMSVSIPKGMATDRKEQSLFKEVADDIAFAMYVIESDEKKKQSQEALRKSEEFNKRIIESSIDCIKILDLDGRLEFMSEGGQKLMEIEDIGPYLNQSWVDSWKGSDHKAALEAISKAKEGDIGHFQGYSPTEKGTEKWWDIIITPIMGKDGKVERLLSVSRDITGYKRLEAQFRQAQKMEAIGTLTGGIAHDFNNLLTAILGNAQLALMKVIKDESLRKEIQEIKKAGDRAASLTRQLLAFSRKQIIKPEILDINEVINETEKMLKRMIKEDIEFLTVLEPELWKVYADPGQIDQVSMNLVVNARDAMPQGGKLTIETANVELDETYFQGRDIESQPGPYVMLAVTDNGTGMDKETLSRIFDPFFTTKEIGSGTGLGLSTVYGIVKQNKGYCWVYSEPGKGTTFKIYFPRVAGDVTAGKEDEEFAGEISGSETVLIVEDDDALRKLAKNVLRKYGYKILEAANGENALNNVSEMHDGPIHLLLTDVVMPGMSGSDLAEKLQSIRPETRVVYMSGYTDNVIAHHGILRQGINFIEKPFSPKSLGKKVRQVLDKESEK